MKRRAHRQVGEVGDLHVLVAELGAEARHFLVRQLQEFVEQAELVHHVQRRGMDGVAAEVAQEVAVLLQHDGPHAGARQQEAQHHAGRPAAHDAALGGDRRHSSISRKHAARRGDGEQRRHAERALDPFLGGGRVAHAVHGDEVGLVGGEPARRGLRLRRAPALGASASATTSRPGRAHFDASFSACSASGISRPEPAARQQAGRQAVQHARGKQHALVARHRREVAGAGIDQHVAAIGAQFRERLPASGRSRPSWRS